MNKPESLDRLFTNKLFRIPDYQRGYAWRSEQLDDFWEDLITLPDDHSHYTGMLTLNEVKEVKEDSEEYWLIDDHSYKLYHIVDGQQRLTTFILFLQALIELFRDLPENSKKKDEDIDLAGTLSIKDVEERFLCREKRTGGTFRTYKFGYTVDNPSYDYMRHRILGEDGGGDVSETFYTLNLSNGKSYFKQKLQAWHEEGGRGIPGLHDLYRKLTKRFLFNEYIIEDEFDVHVTFETMNNRGKKLSNLELLKNRLIYLTTLYTKTELDDAGRKKLRGSINRAWKEVYYQLGRNKSKPLNDDEFLKAHWMMYFKYSRQTGQDYIKYLLEEEFTPKRVHLKTLQPVELAEIEEQISDPDLEADAENRSDEIESGVSMTEVEPQPQLRADEIQKYVKSLKDASVHWFCTHCPEMSSDHLTEEQIEWIQRLNRLGMGYFRPLLMAILKKCDDPDERLKTFQEIERFIFIVFRLSQTRTNYCSSVFSNAVRAVDRGEMDLTKLRELLQEQMSFMFTDKGHFKDEDFYVLLQKKFESGQGYCGWSGILYFLYEYDLELRGRRPKKVDWTDLLKTPKDHISIEHIFPQSETEEWKATFKSIPEQRRERYRNSLGNLLLLSSSINSSLQNYAFTKKKEPQYNRDGIKIRNGYKDGSHSEIQVAENDDWGPDQIRERGIRLLEFMERRWKIKFTSQARKEQLLGIGRINDDKPDEADSE